MFYSSDGCSVGKKWIWKSKWRWRVDIPWPSSGPLTCGSVLGEDDCSGSRLWLPGRMSHYRSVCHLPSENTLFLFFVQIFTAVQTWLGQQIYPECILRNVCLNCNSKKKIAFVLLLESLFVVLYTLLLLYIFFLYQLKKNWCKNVFYVVLCVKASCWKISLRFDIWLAEIAQ